MTPELIQQIIVSQKLPKDELDRFKTNFGGFFPATLFLIAGLGPIIAPKTTMTTPSIQIILIMGIVVFVYTIYAKLTERNLKLVKTRLNKEENEQLVNLLATDENWSKMTNMNYFHSFHLPFVWSHLGFKLILIATDEGILINFRNRGTVQTRMPYQLGIETFKQKKIEKKIKDYAQQQPLKKITDL